MYRTADVSRIKTFNKSPFTVLKQTAAHTGLTPGDILYLADTVLKDSKFYMEIRATLSQPA